MAKILCIEVELSQVRVAEIEEKGKKSRIYHLFRFAVPQGAVEDGHVRDTQSVGEALRRELDARHIKTKKVCFVVASSRIASREIRLPMVKQNRLQSIIEANATDYFPIDVTKYVMSWSILDVEEQPSEGGKGKDRQYHMMVFASPKSISAGYQELAKTAGLNLIRLDYAGNSVYTAVRRQYAQGTHMLIKIEEKSTLITFIHDGELALQRNVNYGVDSAIETVRSFPEFGSDLDVETAEALLCTKECINSSMDMPPEEEGPDMDGVREARREVTESLRYLIGNISRILDYYLSRHQGEEIESIACCGLGAEFMGFVRLLTNELGQEVQVVESLDGVTMPKGEETGMAGYVAIAGSMQSAVNLMEKAVKKDKAKAKKDSLSGAILVFVVGVGAAAALSASSVMVRLYQQKEQDRLNRRIEEERAIEEVYNTYNETKDKYDKFQIMYDYTNTPNENLVAFIEEMEEKMPTNITVDSFSSTGTDVSFSLRVTSKSEAANTLIQLRTFESLATVTTTGITEAEDGTVSMSVSCTYSNPAPIDSGKYNQ